MSEDRSPTTPRPTGGAGVTRFAARGDHRLSYESIGAADGVPMLGLHDLLADRGQLRPLADALPLDRSRLTLPDARGHGASPTISARAYPTAELAADALEVLDAEGLAQVRIAAIGWGAGIALGMALLAPERVAALVLVAPFLPTLAGDDETLAALRQAADAAEKGQIDRALDLYVGMRVGFGWREQLSRARLGAMRRAAAGLAPLLAGMEGETFSAANVARLKAPVTLLLSEDASGEATATLADLFPHARTERLRYEASTQPHEPGWILATAHALLPESGA